MVKDMFLRDLDFYGIIPVEGSVKTASEAWAIQVKDRRSKISQLTSKADRLTLENDIEFLANHCASCYLNGRTEASLNPRTNDQPDIEQLCRAAAAINNSKVNQDFLSKLLSKFGLRLKKVQMYGYDGCFIIEFVCSD